MKKSKLEKSHKNHRNGAGFTLIEIIVALGLGILVLTLLMMIVFPGLAYLRDIKRTENLHANALFLSNTLTYWLKQSESIAVLASSTIEIRLPDSSIKKISTEGNNLIINDVPFNLNNAEVTALVFTQMQKSIQISFTIKAKGAPETVSVVTTVAGRNNP